MDGIWMAFGCFLDKKKLLLADKVLSYIKKQGLLITLSMRRADHAILFRNFTK
jgi:hypothetical protein